MTTVVRWVGVMIAVGFMALSLLINWRYGVRLGRDGIDQWIFSFASLLADMAKAVTPFFVVVALARRQWMAGVVAAVFWAVCTCYSLLCVAGFMEANHAVAAGGLASQQETDSHMRTELRRKQSERDALGNSSASPVVAAKIQQAQQDRRWTGSGTCAAPRDAADRKFCASLAALEVERVQATEAERLERESASLRLQIVALSGTTKLAHGDPRVDFLSRFVSWRTASIEAFLAVLLLALLEIGSGLGLYMTVGHGALRPHVGSRDGTSTATTHTDRPVATVDDTTAAAATRPVATERVMPRLDTPAETDSDSGAGGEGQPATVFVAGDVAKFARDCLQPSLGNAVAVPAMFAGYCAWCANSQTKPLAHDDFEHAMTRLAEAVPLRTATRGKGCIMFDVEMLGARPAANRHAEAVSVGGASSNLVFSADTIS